MENKNGQGIFLGVVGVATLVVAIIGATFAFFSAQAQAGEGVIEGNTLDVGSTALKLIVEKVTFSEAANISASLVPADITVSDAGVVAALNGKCQDDGYTGCHLYRVSAKTTNDLSAASLLLSLSTTNVNAQSDWKYIVFTGTVKGTTNGNTDFTGLTAAQTNTASIVAYNSTNVVGSFPKTVGVDGTPNAGDTYDNVDMHGGQPLTAAAPAEYFLLIYLGNENHSQNQNTNTNLNATGSYSGTVTFQAGEAGTVSASFSV